MTQYSCQLIPQTFQPLHAEMIVLLIQRALGFLMKCTASRPTFQSVHLIWRVALSGICAPLLFSTETLSIFSTGSVQEWPVSWMHVSNLLGYMFHFLIHFLIPYLWSITRFNKIRLNSYLARKVNIFSNFLLTCTLSSQTDIYTE